MTELLTPDIAAVFATVTDYLGAHSPHPVYRHGAPVDVDPTRPWIVVQHVPGGGPSGTALQTNREWQIGLRVIGAARTPNAHGAPTQAVYDAATDAAEAARVVLLHPDLIHACGLVAVDYLASFGEDHEGDVVNVTADYQIRVDTF